MRLISYCDVYGYSHVRTVEHYFHYWGGYSPSPLMFLTAACQHTKTATMVTGAVLPAFNHPLKLASQIAMLDGLSNGRLEVGFARAFLPQEFRHFGVDIDESVERFEEGIEQVQKLLEEENVTCKGRFHSFSEVTTHPRPTQSPRPPLYVAAVGTPASFEQRGAVDPMALMKIYRDAWAKRVMRKPKLMMAVMMYCHEDRDEAMRIAKPRVEAFTSIADAMSEYARARLRMLIKITIKCEKKLRCKHSVADRGMAAFVGTPDDIEQLRAFNDATGGCDEVSMQVLYDNMAYEDAERSVKLFGEEVIPRFQGLIMDDGKRVPPDPQETFLTEIAQNSLRLWEIYQTLVIEEPNGVLHRSSGDGLKCC